MKPLLILHWPKVVDVLVYDADTENPEVGGDYGQTKIGCGSSTGNNIPLANSNSRVITLNTINV